MMAKCFCILFFASCPLIGCLDDIEIDLPRIDGGRLVVSGHVDRSPDLYQFLTEVRRTTQLENYLVVPESSVEIDVIYNRNEIFSLANGELLTFGVEEFHQQFGGDKSNCVFNIKITLDSGSMFMAEEQDFVSPPLNRSLSIGYEERLVRTEVGSIVDRGFVILNITTDLVNSEGRRVSMLYTIDGVYRFPEGGPPDKIKDVCYVPDSWPKNEIITLNGGEIEADSIRDHKMTETAADSRFSAGYYFTVIGNSIHRDAVNYFQEVGQSIKREGTIFDVPIGAVRSNIRQIKGDSIPVLGYFYTAAIDTIRYLAKWEETGMQSFPCDVDPFKDGCEKCLTLVGSSLDKPHYWIN